MLNKESTSPYQNKQTTNRKGMLSFVIESQLINEEEIITLSNHHNNN